MTPHSPDFFPDYLALIDQALKQYIRKFSSSNGVLSDAIKYSTLLGGKRIRPILALTTAYCVGNQPQSALACASAIELIHAYSLIHDDLPAMDDDELRRGHPTCHIAFNEATAILAGDALQAMAFEIIASEDTYTSEQKVMMIQTLAKASGARGMVYGQGLDVNSMGKNIDLAALETMHRHKTGMLIEASVTLGALTCKQAIDTSELHLFKRYAQSIGLAFQVQDDILDVISDTKTLGKTQGADEALNKPTYPSIIGLEGAKKKLYDLHNNALDSLEQLTRFNTKPLAQISHFIVERVR